MPPLRFYSEVHGPAADSRGSRDSNRPPVELGYLLLLLLLLHAYYYYILDDYYASYYRNRRAGNTFTTYS